MFTWAEKADSSKSMLGTLFIGAAVEAVDRALGSALVEGAIAVVGAPRLTRALSDRGRSVVAIGDYRRAVRRTRVTGACASALALPFGDGALAAVVGAGAGTTTAWPELLREWSRAVAEGGVAVMVDRAAGPELSRRAMCGGMMDLEQRAAGRTIVTSGLVARNPG